VSGSSFSSDIFACSFTSSRNSDERREIEQRWEDKSDMAINVHGLLTCYTPSPHLPS